MSVLSSTVRWRAFHRSGVQLLPFRQWYLVIWAIHLLQVFASLVMLVLVRTYSMVSTLSMHRVKTLLQVSVHHSRLQRRVHFVGQHSRILMRRLVRLSILQWKRLCQSCTSNFMHFRTSWRSTTMICRIWSLLYRKVSFGSSRLVTVSVLVQQWLRLQWTCSTRVRLTRRQHLCVVSQTSLTNSSIQCLIRRHWHRLVC